MYKRARIPMFLWERRACANSGAQAVFPRPRKNGLGTRRGKVIRRSPPRVGVPIGYVQSPPIAPPGPRWGEWGLLLIGAQE